ncbi:MAG: hypothetical protein WAM14_10210 [Candidatus Nitrosopolaris sp.]
MDSPITTDIGITMNYRANNKVWQDMVQFIDRPLASERTPVLRLNRFSFLLPILASFDRLNIPKNELDEVLERQEYAFNKSREGRSG